MSRDKQIEERRDISDIIYWSGYGFDRGTCNDISKQIQEQGYRKASDVAREIFEEIEKEIKLVLEINKEEKDKLINSFFSFSLLRRLDSKIEVLQAASKFIAELKKKYESEGEG